MTNEMKVSTLKITPQKESVNNRSLRVQTYGDFNDLPQRISELVNASITGRACYDNYWKFIRGRGFRNSDFSKVVINGHGDTVDALLESVAKDFAMFNGFAVHINYDANFRITSACHIPFEWVRFEALDDDYRFNRLAVHPDWGRRYIKLRRFKTDDIVFFHFFDPDPDTIEKEVLEAGGWNGYKGQILYYSGAGDRVYPLPVFSAALTDMSSEEGLSNVTYRNVRCNFIPAGMVIDKNNSANSEEQEEETRSELSEFQGDANALKLLYVNLKDGEEPPEFRPFESRSTDKDFEKAEAKTPDNIGAAFVQPPILRAKDVGANFGADLMKNAYDFYNAQTETERQIVEDIFSRIFSLWHDEAVNPDGDYGILSKVYRVEQSIADRLGDKTDRVLEIVRDTSLREDAKKTILSRIYGVDEDDIDKLLEGVRNADNG